MIGLDLILSGIVAALVAVAGAWFAGQRKGRVSQKEKQEAQANEEYRETRERVDEAVRRSDGDTRPVDERLRDHSNLRD